MKIVQICPYDIDRPGGVQNHIRDTALALAERGHQVTIIAPATATPPRPELLRQRRTRTDRDRGPFFFARDRAGDVDGAVIVSAAPVDEGLTNPAE